MEKVDKYTKTAVATGWITTAKTNVESLVKTPQASKETEEKIVSRLTFEQDPEAQVSFNTYQAILDRRNQMLHTVKPNTYQYGVE